MSYSPPAIVLRTPLVLPVNSPWCAYSGYYSNTTSAPASATSPTANQAIYVPIVVTTTATFTRGFWWNGSAPGGNTCVGLYTPDGTRQATTGSVASSGASAIQSAAFAASYVATPGIYYMAIQFSAATVNGTSGYGPSLLFRMIGLYTQAVGSFPLPASATFATWTSFLLPHFGITQTSFAI